MGAKNDLTGKKFGRLTVIKPTDKRIDNDVIWECECDCGKCAEVKTSNLNNGKTRSCGCLRDEMRRKRAKDLTGKKFGMLTAIEPTDKRYNGTSVIWKCECDCGNICEATSYVLTHGTKRSCGCLVKTRKPTNVEINALNNFIRDSSVEGTQIHKIRNPEKLRKNNTSGCTGVFLKSGRWVAEIKFKRKTYYLGSYEKKEDAIRARRGAEAQIYGQFLEWYAENYPEKWERLQKKGKGKMDLGNSG